MKKTLLFVCAAALTFGAATSNALTFSTVRNQKSPVKFSSCAWESDPHNYPVPLKGKPGRNDSVCIVMGSNKVFEIDASPEIRLFSVLYDNNVIIKGKRFTTTRGGINFSNGGGPNNSNSFKMVKTAGVMNGGVNFSLFEQLKNMGSSSLILEDSTLQGTGGIVFTNPALYLKGTKGRSGSEIVLTGASTMKMKGMIMLDSILTENANLHFRFVFNEKDGKMPLLSVKSASMAGAEIRVNVNGQLKKGTYPFFEFTDKKSSEAGIRGYFINNKPVSLGSSVQAGGKSVSIQLGSAEPRGAGAKNDFVLVVE